METFKTRLERLEKQNRLIKRTGGSLLVVVAAAIMMAWTSPAPKEVVTEALTIKDSRGNDRAWLCVNKQDLVQLVLLNEDGTPTATLVGDEYGAHLILRDILGERRVQLTADSIDPCLKFYETDGEIRIRYPKSMGAGQKMMLQAMTDMILLKKTVQNYRLHNFKLPDSLQVLLEPNENFGGDPFVEDADTLLDPWGNEYIYIIHSSKVFEIASLGSDNAEGGVGDAEDISSKFLNRGK